jgi:class 3 adenylate cyclase/TolB-like protein/pimeloyl-ACP methyl ester carboxylesterase
VILLPGAVLPADLAYGALIEALGGEVEAVAKDLEIYAGEVPPADYTLDAEVVGAVRAADRRDWEHFHLVGYSAGGAAALATAARHRHRLLSLALLEPAWAGDWDLSDAEQAIWREHAHLDALTGDAFMAAFVRLELRRGVIPPPRPPGPPPPWMATRPTGIHALTRAFRSYDLDRESLRRLHRPVYYALGGLSNPDHYREIAERLSRVFDDFTLEVFADRHHFDPPHRAEPGRVAHSLQTLWKRAARRSPPSSAPGGVTGSAERGPRTEHAAVVNGDVAGYSRLIADNEIETHQTLQAFRRIIEAVVTEEQGRVVNFVGDEFLAVLPTRTRGLAAAVAIQRALAGENARLPAARQMRLRLGVNYGVVSIENDRWFGDAINVAARLQSLATPGGICASATVVAGGDDLPIRFRSLGRRRLKNIPEPVLAYEIVNESPPEGGTKPWRRRIPPSGRPSLAVNPFVNLGDPADSHLADGLMLAVAIELMTLPGVDVVSEASTLGYRDRAHSAQQMAHELGVRYVLEGAVQRDGSRLRVLTQVVDVEKSAIVWADRLEAELSDVFAAQDDIVAKIAEALDVEVIGGDLARSYRDELEPEEVEIVYRGLQELAQNTPDSIRRAIRQFDQIVDRRGESPLGHSLAAWAHFSGALGGRLADRDLHYAHAKRLAKRAIDRNDASGIGHTILAHLLVLEHDWDAALEAVGKATAERPSCDLAFGVAASVMRYLGRWEEAVEMAARAIRLSPLMADWHRSVLANALFVGEDYEDAIEAAESVIADNESNTSALLTLAAAEAALGRHRHASAAIRQVRRATPGLNVDQLRTELPYRDPHTAERFIHHLQEAGLP